ncbi:MAG: hypothetical protein HYZ57_04220 [Acidobacteria bacterium]|nr:hypothetical protein [Acidobacteriota bacterium]MBI3279032.1 hypothetical protein [Acidobacteriota bacterium]
MRLAVLLPASVAAETLHFSTSQPAEVVAELRMRSPGADWAVRGREAAVARVQVDGRAEQHVVLFAGPAQYTYRVFLGPVSPGEHELTVERDDGQSARDTGLVVHGVKFLEFAAGAPHQAALAHSPVLLARANTIGRFSDVPLLVYCERLNDEGRHVLQYTVIFSNEDGGTSTRALMARWGRTTDIEYVYRSYLDSSGKVEKATVQGRGHKELPFEGEYLGAHPVLMPVTDNNMVEGNGRSSMRYQPAPLEIDLADAAREKVMDEAPVLYEVMAKELAREGKIRAWDIAAGESISDPRNYLYLEYNLRNVNAAAAVEVRLKGGHKAYSSTLGRLDYAISRDGWVRTAVELPPGTSAGQLAEIGFQCLVAPPGRDEPPAHSGRCGLNGVRRMFFLGKDYRPGPNLWSAPVKIEVRSGETAVFPSW